MDAIKFLQEHERMCVSYDHCVDCPLSEGVSKCSYWPSTQRPEGYSQIVKAVEDWSAAHLHKTRQDVFLEQYPETVLDSFGVIAFCPKGISAAYRDSSEICKNPEKMCRDCRKEFWMQEVE